MLVKIILDEDNIDFVPDKNTIKKLLEFINYKKLENNKTIIITPESHVYKDSNKHFLGYKIEITNTNTKRIFYKMYE